MCSILGYINSHLSIEEIKTINLRLSHRGPDNSEVKKYKLKTKNVFLGHNRLSIQDLDSKANQPMENDEFAIVFNGEIYNHLEIRNKLKFNNFKTHSDTETLIYAFSEFGIEKTLSQLIGMFAIGLLNKKENKLYLIRDRVGIKPLYWTYQNNEFAFASELKGFSNHLKNKKSDKAVVQFMSFGYIPNDNSYYENIYKLKPAHYLVFDGENININKYWSLSKNKIKINYDEAIFKTEEIIRSSIKYRLLSDLEVGSFLSGGVDSSLVSAIMQQESNSNIKTFSIGFEDKNYDESIYAKEVAKHLGSDHYEYKFKVNDVLELIQDFDKYYDEPFGDSSSLPMMLLSRMTKDKVSVALSGDGGDELFLGYDRYFFTQNYYNRLKKIPKPMRSIIAFLFKYSKQDKLEKMSYPIKNLNEENLYSILYSSIKPWDLNKVFSEEFLYETFDKDNLTLLDLQETKFKDKDLMDNLSKLDFNRYLPDDILTKVDRASMAYGLEARVPLLDHRLVEFAYSLPNDIKLMNGPKAILKDILYKYIPKELIDRPKKGFGVPLKYWFRDELKDILYDKIHSLDNRFNKKNMLNFADKHIYKNYNYEYILWNIMRIK